MLIWILPVLGGCVFLVVVGALHRCATHPVHTVPSLVDRLRADRLKEDLEVDQVIAERHLNRARRAQAAEQPGRAIAALGHSATAIRDAVPSRITRLRGMSLLARLAAASFPSPRLQLKALSLAALRLVAAVGSAVHTMAVSFEDRLRVRLVFLRWAYRALGLEATKNVVATRDSLASTQIWARAESCVRDLKTLDAQQVEHYESLLAHVHEAALIDEPAPQRDV